MSIRTMRTFLGVDELCDKLEALPQREQRRISREARLRRAKDGWFNWYANRGRIGLSPAKKELRQVSWRRAH